MVVTDDSGQRTEWELKQNIVEYFKNDKETK
jgi:hypothetical protein